MGRRARLPQRPPRLRRRRQPHGHAAALLRQLELAGLAHGLVRRDLRPRHHGARRQLLVRHPAGVPDVARVEPAGRVLVGHFCELRPLPSGRDGLLRQGPLRPGRAHGHELSSPGTLPDPPHRARHVPAHVQLRRQLGPRRLFVPVGPRPAPGLRPGKTPHGPHPPPRRRRRRPGHLRPGHRLGLVCVGTHALRRPPPRHHRHRHAHAGLRPHPVRRPPPGRRRRPRERHRILLQRQEKRHRRKHAKLLIY
mmetsp:Transcript_18981/g.58498  ORF Transcript_18981/g.58498 Transcript_18981/m.58498 type:complete len:251 (+) Transcript_18981:281-1033(+)